MKLKSVDTLVNAILVLDRFIGPPQRADTARRLVGIYYDNIHKVPVKDLPAEQAKSIARRLYKNAVQKMHDFRHTDREILRKLARMQRGEIAQSYDTEERMCIMMENYAADHPIVLEYERVTGKIQGKSESFN